jgi:hypothetical protein
MLLTVKNIGRVLDLYDADHPERGPTEAASELGMGKSKTHLLMSSMAKIGLLRRTAGGRLERPTLVLWTEDNPGQTTELAERVSADLPDGRFEVLTDCAHWPQFEPPDVFNEVHIGCLPWGWARIRASRCLSWRGQGGAADHPARGQGGRRAVCLEAVSVQHEGVA